TMLQNDLHLEYQVVADVREVMAYCESVQDYVTRDILLKMLDDTEVDHAYWLEKQLGLIKRIGLQNYLQ
ncbi:ferritin-like domain-containing protein, partial [Wenyingzhuangia sp. 1_MG-2023]|nr:ferritin-like domain-containing protein [Wenyingzhuangia sp. 1_MG-2023]